MTTPDEDDRSNSMPYLAMPCHQHVQRSPQDGLLDFPINVGNIKRVVGMGDCNNRGVIVRHVGADDPAVRFAQLDR